MITGVKKQSTGLQNVAFRIHGSILLLCFLKKNIFSILKSDDFEKREEAIKEFVHSVSKTLFFFTLYQFTRIILKVLFKFHHKNINK